MKCTIQFKIILYLIKRYAQEGRFRFIQYRDIYAELCKDVEDKENCKSKIRIAINSLVREGWIRKHSRGRGKREIRPTGDLEKMIKEIDMTYRYGEVFE